MSDPRNNADDAYDAFVSMSDDEWRGLLASLSAGGVLEVEERRGFERAMVTRGAKYDPPAQGESSSDAMRRLTSLVVEMAKLEIKKLDLESELETATKELRRYQEDLVPGVMEEIGLSTLKTIGGIEVEMQETVRAAFPKEESKQAVAFAWLKASGNDGLVKREVTVKYGRDSVEWADQLVQRLEEWGVSEHGVVEQDWTIHHSTLVSFLRGELREGREVPLESFGAYVQRRAVIKRGK